MFPLIKKKLSFLGGSVDVFFFFHSKNTLLAPMPTKYIIVDQGAFINFT